MPALASCSSSAWRSIFLLLSLSVTATARPDDGKTPHGALQEDVSSPDRVDRLTHRRVRSLYLNALRDSLTGRFYGETYRKNPSKIARGTSICRECYTLCGAARLQNLRRIMEQVVVDGIHGDFLEAGAWRGGTSIFAAGVWSSLAEEGRRRVYVCDSFEGLPLASQDRDIDTFADWGFFEVSLMSVREHFRRFRLLQQNVVFVPGFFAASLPKLREELRTEGRRLAVLHVDADMYESCLDVLFNLYDLVAVGGFVLCDDCRTIDFAGLAIAHFRKTHDILEPLRVVNNTYDGVFWQKAREVEVHYEEYRRWSEQERIFRTKKPAAAEIPASIKDFIH